MPPHPPTPPGLNIDRCLTMHVFKMFIILYYSGLEIESYV